MIRLGIIGTNFITDWLLTAAAPVKELVPCSVYSRSEQTGRAFAEKYGITRVETDLECFLSDPNLDAVYVASPNFLHAQQSIAAMEHGKHVLCEKAIASNSAEFERMYQAAIQHNVVFLEAMRPRFDPVYTLIRNALPKLGKIRRIGFEYCQYSSRYDRFRAGERMNTFNPELSNAAIMDIGVYCIASLVLLFGAPEHVSAASVILENGMEGAGELLLQYPNLPVHIAYSKITQSTNPSIIQGEDGTMTIDMLSKPQDVRIQYRDGSVEILPLHAPDGFGNMRFEAQEFVRLVESGTVQHPYHEQSRIVMDIIDQARRQTGVVFPADCR